MGCSYRVDSNYVEDPIKRQKRLKFEFVDEAPKIILIKYLNKYHKNLDITKMDIDEFTQKAVNWSAPCPTNLGAICRSFLIYDNLKDNPDEQECRCWRCQHYKQQQYCNLGYGDKYVGDLITILQLREKRYGAK